jgi:cell cycle sensor histidine kinase DivJ
MGVSGALCVADVLASTDGYGTLAVSSAAMLPAMLTILVTLAGRRWPSGRKFAVAILPWILLCACLVALTGGLASPAMTLVLLPLLFALHFRGGARAVEAGIFSVLGLGAGVLSTALFTSLPSSAAVMEATGILALAGLALAAYLSAALFSRIPGSAQPGIETERSAPSPAETGAEAPVMMVDVTRDGTVRSVSGRAPGGIKPSSGAALLEAFPEPVRGDVARCLSSQQTFAQIKAEGEAVDITCDPYAQGMRVFLSAPATSSDPVAAADIIAVDAERRAMSAETALQERTAFFASLGHELKTPLNAILGFSDLMRTELRGDLPEAYKEYAQLIHESGQDLLLTVEDILDYAKAEAGHARLELEPVDLVASCESVIAQLSAFAERSGVAIRQKATAEAWAVADARAVRQIWQNLLSNAIKYSASGGSVSLDARAGSSTVALSVRDTGAGMSEVDLERIAKPFQQGTNAKGRAGTGLGLAVVKAFADQMAGKVIIDTAPGEGTRVRVILPRAVDEDVVFLEDAAQ